MLVLSGLPGSGKTTLSKVFASSAASKGMRQLVFFVRSSQMMQGYAAIAQKISKMVDSNFTSKQILAMSEEELAHFVHGWLMDDLRDKWLCVIDDAPNPEDDVESAAGEHVRAFPFGYGKVLITSRFSAWAQGRGGTDQCMEVGSYSGSEACNRVKWLMGSQWEGIGEEVLELVTALKLFPLAIEQAVGYCKENLVASPREFLERMKAAPAGSLKARAKKSCQGNEYPESFVEVLGLIWQQLVDFADEGDPSGIHTLLRKLAFLHPDDIPSVLFDETEKRYLVVLRKFSLVSLETLSVHAMTQDAVRDFFMGRSRISTMNALVASLQTKMDRFEQHKKATHFIGARYVRHVRMLVSHVREGDKELARGNIRRLACASTYYLLDFVCHFQAAQIMIENLLVTIFTASKPVRRDSGLSTAQHENSRQSLLFWLANVLSTMNKHSEALAKYEESLAIMERLVGREHMGVAASLSSIGVVLDKQGKYSEALAKYEESLAIMERLVGREHMLVANTLKGVGNALQNQEKYSQAIETYEESLAIIEKLVGWEHMEAAKTLEKMGDALESQGNDSEALAKREESQAIKKRLADREGILLEQE